MGGADAATQGLIGSPPDRGGAVAVIPAAPVAPSATGSLDLWSALGLAAVALAIRMLWIDHPALWKDEVFSLVNAWHSYDHHFDLKRVSDIHPPLYPVLLKTWGAAFGENRIALRSLSALLGAVSIIPLYFLVRRWQSAKVALLSALFLAVNPLHIHFSRELRNYSALSLLLLGAVYFFSEICGRDRRGDRRVPVALFALSLSLCYYTHYIAVLFFPLFGLAALAHLQATGDTSRFREHCLGLAIATLLCVPQTIHMFGYSLGDGAARDAWIPLTTPTTFYQQTLGAYPFPALFKPAMAALYALGAWQLYRRSRSLFDLTMIFAGLALLLCAFVGMFKGIYLVRSIQCFVLLSGVWLANAISALPARQTALAAAALVGINLWSARVDYPADRVNDPGRAFLADLAWAQPRAVFYDTDLEYYMRAERVDVRGWHGLFLDRVGEGGAAVDAHLARCARRPATCGNTALIIAVNPPFFASEAQEWNDRADWWARTYESKIDKLADGYRLVVF